MNKPLPSRIRLSGRGAVFISLSRASAKPVSRLPGGLVTGSKFKPGCRTPLISTGSRNSSAIQNSLFSCQIAESAKLRLNMSCHRLGCNTSGKRQPI